MRYSPLAFAVLLAGCFAPPPEPPPEVPAKPPEPVKAEEPEILTAEGWGEPLAALPAHVAAPARQVTVFADFEHAAPATVPVYLVNRTRAAIPLDAQDGDLFLKLEYESSPGVWTRAQRHVYSWCGNSYRQHSLEPGRFVVLEGHRAVRGDDATVRYRFYGQKGLPAFTNAAVGLVDPAAVEEAAGDAMAIGAADFATIRRMVLTPRKVVERPLADLSGVLEDQRRRQQFDRLVEGPFPAEAVEAVLREIAADPKHDLAAAAQRRLEAGQDAPK